MKNCFTCALSKEKGEFVKCDFQPSKKQLAEFPFYPVFHIQISRVAVKKANVPDRDCPTWKARKNPPTPKGP